MHLSQRARIVLDVLQYLPAAAMLPGGGAVSSSRTQITGSMPRARAARAPSMHGSISVQRTPASARP
jgi:hypothetical protein